MLDKTITPIQIRFSDVDMAQHVHNAAYFQYFESARMDFFEKILSTKHWDWKNRGIILAKNEADYYKPVFLHDNIEIETKCSHLGDKSITLSFSLYKYKEDEKILCNEGKCILVCMDYVKQETVPVYSEWKRILKQIVKP